MPKILKTVLKIFAVLIISVLVFAIGFIGWLTITEFKPDDVMSRPVMEDHFIADRPMSNENSLKVLTFNIGYGNLGKESDFFMDGGKNAQLMYAFWSFQWCHTDCSIVRNRLFRATI